MQPGAFKRAGLLYGLFHEKQICLTQKEAVPEGTAPFA